MRSMLILATRFPYPPIGGDRLKLYNYIKLLSTEYKITLICFQQRGEQEPDNTPIANMVHKIILVPLPRLAHLRALISALLTGKPFQTELFRSKLFSNTVQKESKNIDVTIATLIRTAQYLNNTDNSCIKICDMTDSIALNYSRSIKSCSSLLHSIYYRFEHGRLFQLEKELVQKVDLTLFVNPNEAEFWGNFGKTKAIPLGTDAHLSLTPIPTSYTPTITFLGKMDYQPNIDAVTWFISKVMPLLPPQIEFHIYGANTPTTLKKTFKDNTRVHFHGFVENPHQAIAESLAFVAPMQTGGGVQNKVLEALAAGALVIGTPLTLSGIQKGSSSPAFLIAESPIDFATLITELFNNPISYLHIRQAARDLIKHYYTWETTKTTLHTAIRDLFNTNRTG